MRSIPFDQVHSGHRSDRGKLRLRILEPSLEQERFERIHDFCVPRLVPSDHVQLIHGHDDLGNPKAPNEHEVFAGLAAPIEPRLKLPRRRIDDEQGAIRLRSTRNHVWDEILMPWRIEDGDVSTWSRERIEGDVHGDPPTHRD